jgi:hypothetical protein
MEKERVVPAPPPPPSTRYVPHPPDLTTLRRIPLGRARRTLIIREASPQDGRPHHGHLVPCHTLWRRARHHHPCQRRGLHILHREGARRGVERERRLLWVVWRGVARGRAQRGVEREHRLLLCYVSRKRRGEGERVTNAGKNWKESWA